MKVEATFLYKVMKQDGISWTKSCGIDKHQQGPSDSDVPGTHSSASVYAFGLFPHLSVA